MDKYLTEAQVKRIQRDSLTRVISLERVVSKKDVAMMINMLTQVLYESSIGEED